ncbi:hypothetical protein A2U01_0070829 [Trifolium medium]|uniref:Uncharacterized protein n=1 Tax=Trifolium medium TaxID=97028 RepID=A0A392SNK4_9FABA|nr:hypothetical protein [Trifolium medium]
MPNQNVCTVPSQQKNMEVLTSLCNLGSSGIGMFPSESGLKDASDNSSKFRNCPI